MTTRTTTRNPAELKAMQTVLGGLADVERDLIRTRTAEGRSRAQKRGQHMGRPMVVAAVVCNGQNVSEEQPRYP